ncbi:MMPL family transporter [Actinocorallia sp. A-T 12471]|uniref:MMPL family transporter n=1 Tax=Actinocorallia sp. A-T 12471 TaxID=3089813 RepID=UPI0029CF379E|nr:MMPL family transporter [Actinocorallia sp. A-T 12471]MDX6738816.1 MMPL family transporter [Actinocorallia sp. A-T 12471]
MFETWGRLLYRRRKPILWLSLAVVLFFGGWGTGVFGGLTTAGGFDTPSSESHKAATLLEDTFGRAEPDIVVLYEGAPADVATEAAVTLSLDKLPKDKVASVATYWSTGSPQFVSEDKNSTYAVITLSGQTPQERTDQYTALEPLLREAGGLTVKLGGQIAVENAINTRVSSDIARVDAISLPILLVLLLVIFGGVVAASLPLVIGGIAILGSFTALHVLTYLTDVSTFSISITTFLGLGLAIDYGLFMVWRFREELARADGDVETATARTMTTAGRTVIVSGVTVAVSLAGLLVFEQNFLRSMGMGGIGTVVVAMLAAVVVLPALMAVLGPRVNGRRARRAKAGSGERWRRLADAVMRRPLLVAVPIVVLLLALGSPFLRIAWGGVDTRVLPEGTESRVVTETLQAGFAGGGVNPVEVAVQGADEASARSYLTALTGVPGVTGGQVVGTSGDVTHLRLTYAAEPYSDQARDLVERVREVPAPGTTYVGGVSATLDDQLTSLAERLPLLAGIVGTATFVLLFLAFGSILLPLKAILMNLLSLTATFGAIVWIFQDGNLSGLLDFTVTGDIAPAMPILMLALLFGISMDYEVFLLSRIREQYDLTGDNTLAVATGLQRTGSIITTAALLFIVVVAAFATSGITFMKLTGVGMVIAIVVDATVIRALLVPATMRLLGAANWWVPKPLAGIYRRYGIREEGEPVPVREPAPV